MEPPPPSQPPPQPQQPPPYFYPIPMEPPPQPPQPQPYFYPKPIEPPQPPQPQQPPPYFYPIPIEPPPQSQQPPPYYYPIPMEPPQPQQPPQPQPPQPQQQLQPQKKSKKQLKKQQHHSLRVRCTGCQKKSTVGPSLTEFVCSKCHLKQDVVRPPPRVIHLQVPCVNCKAIVTVPHGLPRFPCPHCNTELQAPLPPVPEEVNEVAIEVEQEEDNGGVVGETFTDYRPPKMSIGPPHPDPIVETSSLSAVQPPEPTYDLKTKNYLEAAKVLSCLQIETLVYACQRHQHHLDDGTRAGFFIGDGAGVGKGRTVAGLIWENWQHGRRKALWISVGSDLKFDARRDLDDVGAKCIKVHALNKLPYSKLDSKSVGIKDGVIFLTYSSLIASSETGRSRLQQLVQWCGLKYDGLIVFDECHKAKNLVPEAGGKPTYTGKAVLELQERLPEARVIYCSATGASEPRNLGYVVRLGLWGAGTSFNDFSEFLDAMTKGGVGALELVAMDMKARGMYVCRTLSYKGSEFEVVEVPLEAKMTEIYKKAAEFWIELRVELQAEIEMVGLEKPNLFWRLYWGTHQRFFRSICMSAKIPAVVRLTKQALMENKCVVIGLQSTGEARTEDAVTKYGTELDDFISGPRELLLKFVEEKYPLPEKPESPPEEDSVKELQRKRHSANPDVSFKGRVRKAAKREPTSDDESGEESEWEPESEVESDEESESGSGFESEKSDSESVYRPARHLYTPELLKRYESAVERKSKLLDTIRSFDLPNNPLDELIDQLGGPDNVAEITGRRGMLVRASSGKGVTYQARNTKEISMEMVNMHQKQLFMDGKKLVAIISEAGSAGVSLQADRRVLNQKRRVHVTLELPWSADRAIQQFGRTHRSNQTSAPEYRLLFTNLGGERRFASVVAKRLASLGALTQGDRRAGPSLSAYNYDSLYGKHALMVMYDGILEQDSFPVVPPNCSSENPDTIQDFIEEGKAALVSIGIIKDAVLENGKVVGRFSGTISDSDMYDVGRFLNRLLGLPPESQNRLFELFISIFDHLLYKARLEGNLDPGIVDFRANTIELQGTPKTVHTDHMSGSSTVLYTFIMDRGITWEAASALLNDKQKDVSGSSASGFYESKREWLGRRHFLLAIESSPGSFKIFRAATGETLREMPITELKDKYRKTSLEKVHTKWKDECEVSSKQCMHGPKCKHGRFCTVGKKLQEVNVLGGLILPIWGTIAKALSKQERKAHRRLRVVGIETTTDNQRVVGLLVPNAAVGSVLQDLGI